MFTSCSFTSLYLAGKLSVFSARGIGQSPRLLVVLAPSLVSLLVGVSRIRDKWHHWDGQYSMSIHYYPIGKSVNILDQYSMCVL